MPHAVSMAEKMRMKNGTMLLWGFLTNSSIPLFDLEIEGHIYF